MARQRDRGSATATGGVDRSGSRHDDRRGTVVGGGGAIGAAGETITGGFETEAPAVESPGRRSVVTGCLVTAPVATGGAAPGITAGRCSYSAIRAELPAHPHHRECKCKIPIATTSRMNTAAAAPAMIHARLDRRPALFAIGGKVRA